MISSISVAIWIAMLTADPTTPLTTVPPVVVNTTIVQGLTEGTHDKQFDSNLEVIKPVLKDLPFNTFRNLGFLQQSSPVGEETRFLLTERYSLYVMPESREPNGLIRLTVRIEIAPKQPNQKPINALVTKMVVAPGKMVTLRGLKLDKGELLVVLSVAR